MSKLVMLVCILYCPYTLAESDQASVHFAAHFGLSYAITTVGYGFSKKALRMDDVDARIFSGFLAFGAGFLRQMIQPQFNAVGVWQNALGVGAALGTTYVFSF